MSPLFPFVIGPLAPDEWINDGDSDGDGLTDNFEIEHGLDPESIDSDGDGIVDEFETVDGLIGTVEENVDLWDLREGLADIDLGDNDTPDGGGGGGGCFVATAGRQ